MAIIATMGRGKDGGGGGGGGEVDQTRHYKLPEKVMCGLLGLINTVKAFKRTPTCGGVDGTNTPQSRANNYKVLVHWVIPD